jgi:hypothetical protein
MCVFTARSGINRPSPRSTFSSQPRARPSSADPPNKKAESSHELVVGGRLQSAEILARRLGRCHRKIICDRRRSGFRSVAASRDGATARAPKDRTREASGIASGANARYGRFQREIIPHLDSAYNFARFLSRNADAAQDIVQETFLRAYRSFDGYQGGDARAWIFAIVRNCYHNWLLEGRRKARLEVDVHRRCDAADFSVDEVASDDAGDGATEKI